MKSREIEFPLYLETEDEARAWQKKALTTILETFLSKDSLDDPTVLEERLPVVHVKEPTEDDPSITFTMISLFRADIPKFVYEVLSKWIAPNRDMAIDAFTSTRFKFYAMEKQQYIAIAVTLTTGEPEAFAFQLPMIQKEIELGLRSLYHARKILEIKGYSREEKISAIQERVTELVHRFPDAIDYDIFHLMQKCVVTTSPSFLAARSYKHLTKIISVLYVFTQRLLQSREEFARKRDLQVKIARSEIDAPFGKKGVLSFYIGMQLLKESERFSKEHLLKAVKRFCPDAEILEDAFLDLGRKDDRLAIFYVEMTKRGNQEFTDEEIALLTKNIRSHLNSCIERLVRPVVMPRNEEEVMKYVLVLAGQLKATRDIPQAVIIFNEQTDIDLFFTVVIARPLLPESLAISEVVRGKSHLIDVTVEKSKHMGFIRKKYPKEVAILKVRLSSTPFIREDYAVDVYKARQRVSRHLEEAIGEFRDYNGGMISKQMEILSTLKEYLLRDGKGSLALVENFFHSLYPIEMRSVVHPEFMQAFYLQFHKMYHKEVSENYLLNEEGKQIIFLMKTANLEKKEALQSCVRKLEIPSVRLLSLLLQLQDEFFIGYLYFFEESKDKEIFKETLLENLS